MKLQSVIFSLFSILSVMAQAQPITFEKYYDYGFAEAGNSVQQTSDGGYIIFGRQGIGIGVSKVLLIKTDSNGSEEWYKLIGGNNNDNYAYGGQQTTDGGYIMTGFTSVAGFSSQIYLVKTDANGDSLWTKNFGWTDYDQGYSVQQTIDGGYIIAGYGVDMIDTTYKAILIKTDPNGDTLWTKKYIAANATGGASAYSVQQTTDGGYVFCGSSGLLNGGIFLVKTDSSGDTLWTQSLNTFLLTEIGYSVRQDLNGDYIIAGFGWTGSSNDMLWLKTDIMGDTLWTKTLPGSSDDFLTSAKPTADGGYILTGSTGSFGAGPYDIILIKVNSMGDTVWTKTFGTTQSESVGWSDGAIMQTQEGGFAVVGMADFGNASAYLIKTDSLGFIATGLLHPFPKEISFSVFPNPFFENTTLLISDELKYLSNLSYTIYDLAGYKIKTASLGKGKNEYNISNNNLSQGIYFLQLLCEKRSLGVIKIIIQ